MPPRTQATDPAGLNAAMISPMPSTAAAAEPLVPTCSSIDLNDATRTVPTAPPSRPMPMSSIPIRRISGLTPATLYAGYPLSHGLDSIHGRRPHHPGRPRSRPERAGCADVAEEAFHRGQDQGRARARRPLGELRVPRGEERARDDGGSG